MANLTVGLITKTQATDREVFLWDTQIPGLGIRVLPSGRKSFVLQYRNNEQRTRRIVLGRFGVLTLAQARQKARKLLVEVQEGGDPAQTRQDTLKDATVRELATRYLEHHARHMKKPRSAAEDERLLNLKILPVIGPRKVRGVTRSDITGLHRSMSETPVQANRTLSLCSMLFTCAEQWGMRPEGTNPVKGVQRFPEQPRERYLSAEEFSRLGQTLREVEEDGSIRPEAVACLRVILFTGARRDEIRCLRWDWVDLNGAELHLPDSKTGPKSIPLPAAAVQILAGLDRPCDWVFPAVHGRGPLSLTSSWKTVRNRAAMTDLHIHDLRHSWGALATGAGMPLQVIGKVMGHKNLKTTARYAHAGRSVVHEAAERVSKKIEAALCEGEPATVTDLSG